MIAWIILYLAVGAGVFRYWKDHISHKFNSMEDNAAMLPGIVLLWPLVLLYYRDYL